MRIPLSRPEITVADEQAVLAALRSGWLTNGKETRAFEEEVCAFLGARHAIAVANGTAALMLALQVAGIGSGDEVLVPAFTYPATAHAVVLVGAQPVFVDVDERSWNMAPERVVEACSKRTRALLPVDQFGLPAALWDLQRAAARVSPALMLIEDAACALGASRSDGRCGHDARLACFSFHPRKILTTGEGGMIVTDDAGYAETLRMLRNHGRDAQNVFQRAAANLRMSELAAALGRAQLRRLPQMIAQRQALAARYRQRLRGHPALSWQQGDAGSNHSYQTFAVCLGHSYSRQAVIDDLRQQGIEVGIATYAVHRERPYSEQGDGPVAACPVADRLGQRGLALPLFPGLGQAEVDQVCAALVRALARQG